MCEIEETMSQPGGLVTHLDETEPTAISFNFPTRSETASWGGTAQMIPRPSRPKLSMPVGPYFTYVGASLLILLFVANACLQEPKTTRLSTPQMSETLHIRIRSEHKWPEKIVFVSAPLDIAADRSQDERAATYAITPRAQWLRQVAQQDVK